MCWLLLRVGTGGGLLSAITARIVRTLEIVYAIVASVVLVETTFVCGTLFVWRLFVVVAVVVAVSFSSPLFDALASSLALLLHFLVGLFANGSPDSTSYTHANYGSEVGSTWSASYSTDGAA